MIVAKPLALAKKQSKLRFVDVVIFGLLGLHCFINLLMPVERGAPVLRIAGFPFPINMAYNFAALAVLFIVRPDQVLKTLRRSYLLWHAPFLFVLLLSLFMVNDFTGAGFVVLNYASAFILNFIILDMFLKKALYRTAFIYIVTLVTLAGAALLLLEALARIYLPFYAEMYLNFDYQAMNYSMNVDTNFRALGVQGNPITSSMALLLALPFLFELKNPFFRFGSIGFVIFAVSYTGSRTILILLLPLVVMFFFRNRKLFVPTSLLGLLGLAFGLYLISAANVSQLVNSDNVFVTRLLQPSDSDVDSLDQRLLRLRESVDIFSREEPLNQLIGSGPRSTLTLLSAFLGATDATNDNTYFTLLIEAGLLGLLAFLLAVGWPIYRFWHSSDNYYKAVLIGHVLVGISFVNIYYSSFNFLYAATLAMLYRLEDEKKVAG